MMLGISQCHTSAVFTEIRLIKKEKERKKTEAFHNSLP